ncbi:MAG: hypothetical protein AAFO69_13090, partial [Bacteroidota bacterium]
MMFKFPLQFFSHYGQRSIYILLLAVLFTVSGTSRLLANAKSGSIQYKGQQALILDGEWRFYWNQLLSPADSNYIADLDYQIKTVPSLWDSYEMAGEALPAFGFATYTLTIQCDSSYQQVAFGLSDFNSQYQLLLNGE